MGRVYHEVSATEKRIDSLIDSLRREEFRETECSRELEGYVLHLYIEFVDCDQF